MENRIINKWKRFFSGHIFGKAENNMSKIISLFMERKISKDEIFSLLQLMGGKVHINAPDQVVLEDIEGAVWCYYRGENFNLDDREQLKLKRYSIKCNTELALELGSDENSSRLAEKICKILVDEFGMCIIYSDFVPCSKRILAEMSNALFDLREISGETVFIDGTKIEAAANKYTFVWKKAVTKNQTKLLRKPADFVAECEQLYDLKIVYGDTVKMKHVKKLRKKLYALKQAENVVFVHGIGKRKTPLQKSIETLEDYLSRLKKYNHQIFTDTKKVQLLYNELSKLFKKSDLYTIGVCLDKSVLFARYGEKNLNNQLTIAIQLLIEHYCQFLIMNHAAGDICYEAMQPEQNTKIQQRLYELKALGSMYYSPKTIQDCIREIHFVKKSENMIGLQLADFVPNTLGRYVAGMKPKNKNFAKIVRKKLYDGCQDKTYRFGFKVLS